MKATVQNLNHQALTNSAITFHVRTDIRSVLRRFLLYCFFLAVLSVAADSTSAPATKLEITLTAGAQDRVNVPVSIPIQLLDDLKNSKTVWLSFDNGMELPGQVTEPGLLSKPASPAAKELHFVISTLRAGTTARSTEIQWSVKEPVENTFRWDVKPGDYAELVDNLATGEVPVLRYMFKPLDDSTPESREMTYKVFHHVYDPTGKKFVTKGPPGGLYPHHRGLFYGFNKITYGEGKQADVWHCKETAHQSHEGLLAQEAGPVLGRHRVKVDWHGVGKEVFATEERELTAYHFNNGHLIEFASVLRPIISPVRLDGDPQHAGFHFRAAQEVAEATKAQTYYLRPDGKDDPGKTRNWPDQKEHVNLAWDAMSFVIGGQRYTALYMDQPSNPKEARFSERDYGRFGSYFEYQLGNEGNGQNAQPELRVNYRVWLQEGEMTGERAATMDSDFANPVKLQAEWK